MRKGYEIRMPPYIYIYIFIYTPKVSTSINTSTNTSFKFSTGKIKILVGRGPQQYFDHSGHYSILINWALGPLVQVRLKTK